MREFDHQVALLLYPDGSSRLVRTMDPPPDIWEVPIPQPWSLRDPNETPRYEPMPRRVFRRTRHCASGMRWLRAIGPHSVTPEPVFVYMEDPDA